MVKFGLDLILELNGKRSASEVQKLIGCLAELFSCTERGVHLVNTTHVSSAKVYERVVSSFLVQTTHQIVTAIEAAHIIACQIRKMFREAMYGEEPPKITEAFFPNLTKASCTDYPVVGAIIDSAVHDIAMSAVNLDDILRLSDIVESGRVVQNKNFKALLQSMSQIAVAVGVSFSGDITSSVDGEVVDTVGEKPTTEEPELYQPFKSKTKH